MKKNTVVLCCLAISVVLSAASAADQSVGSISGIVSDEHGNLLAGVKVNAKPMDAGPTFEVGRYCESDKDGMFKIDQLRFGEYSIYTRKDSDLYANSGSKFYSDGVVRKVAISPQLQVSEYP
jgi:hypothetical protein